MSSVQAVLSGEKRWHVEASDVTAFLRSLPEGCVQVCVTSPPYWQLRSYLKKGDPLKPLEIGQEPTPDAYVERMVGVFREVRRVLADHGTLWVNVGDSYASDTKGSGGKASSTLNAARDERGHVTGKSIITYDVRKIQHGLKPLDQCCIPHRLYLALIADGWYGRADCVWAKRSAMPISVRGWRWERCRVKVKAQATRTDNKKAIAHSERTATFKERYERGEGVAEWSDCPGCKKCERTGGLVLRKGSWRPTSAHEYLFLLAKGSMERVSRVIEFADLDSERLHLGKHLGLQHPESSHFESAAPSHGHGVGKVCVALASAIFDAAQRDNQFRLPPFYAKEWQDGSCEDDRVLVLGTKVVHRAALWSARLSSGVMTVKEFIHKLYSLGVTLPDHQTLRVGDVLCHLPSTPGLFTDGDATIAVHDAGQVCKVDFSHARIVYESRISVPYFMDGDAVRTPLSPVTVQRDQYSRVLDDPDEQCAVAHDHETVGNPAGANLRDVFRHDATAADVFAWLADQNPALGEALERQWREQQGMHGVLWVGPEPLKAAHYAAFPTALVTPLLRASTSERGQCPACGMPWVRVIDRPAAERNGDVDANERDGGLTAQHGMDRTGMSHNAYDQWLKDNPTRTVGWKASCECAGDPVPQVVLDIFAGSGRTGMAARRLGLRFLGCELNPAFAELANAQIAADAIGMPLAVVAPKKTLFDSLEKPNA